MEVIKLPNVITFATLKGGVGKTASAFNFSGILAEQGNKVLVFDVDPQGNVTNNFGIDRTQENFKSVKEVMEDNIPIESVVVKSPVPELPTLDVIPSSIFLAGTETRIVSVAGREIILKNFLEDNMGYLKPYDYIIFDTNPSMSIINQNAFLVSDSIILLSDVSMNGLQGAELFIALWENNRKRLRKDDNVKGLLINNLDKRIKLSADIIDYCKEHEDFKNLMFNTVIPTNVKLKESELEAKPVNIYDKNSTGYSAYISVVEEMRERGIL
jgi:chromosome partitioning protein